jgi:cell wall-associated NlpC family hydrolase
VAFGKTTTATEAEQRAAVVAEAKTWVGTPWHHQADVKGAGVDCAMILVRVFVDTGVVPAFDPRPYSRTWFMHRGEEKFMDIVRQCGAHEIEGPPKPGDLALWKIGRLFAHGSIVVEWPMVIHAFAQARMVVIQDVTQLQIDTKKNPVKFFSKWA